MTDQQQNRVFAIMDAHQKIGDLQKGVNGIGKYLPSGPKYENVANGGYGGLPIRNQDGNNDEGDDDMGGAGGGGDAPGFDFSSALF